MITTRVHTMNTSNSSRMRNGESMACHRAMMKDTVENERSPPDIMAKCLCAPRFVLALLEEYAV